MMKKMKLVLRLRVAVFLLSVVLSFNGFADSAIGDQPLANIAIHIATSALRDSASIKAHPPLLGVNV